AAEPSAVPSASPTSSTVRTSAGSPPNLAGLCSRNIPAAASPAITSSACLRLISPSEAWARSNGWSATARATSSARVGAPCVSWMVDVTCAPIVVYVFVPWDVPGDLELSKLSRVIWGLEVADDGVAAVRRRPRRLGRRDRYGVLQSFGAHQRIKSAVVRFCASTRTYTPSSVTYAHHRGLHRRRRRRS